MDGDEEQEGLLLVEYGGRSEAVRVAQGSEMTAERGGFSVMGYETSTVEGAQRCDGIQGEGRKHGIPQVQEQIIPQAGCQAATNTQAAVWGRS